MDDPAVLAARLAWMTRDDFGDFPGRASILKQSAISGAIADVAHEAGRKGDVERRSHLEAVIAIPWPDDGGQSNRHPFLRLDAKPLRQPAQRLHHRLLGVWHRPPEADLQPLGSLILLSSRAIGSVRLPTAALAAPKRFRWTCNLPLSPAAPAVPSPAAPARSGSRGIPEINFIVPAARSARLIAVSSDAPPPQPVGR